MYPFSNWNQEQLQKLLLEVLDLLQVEHLNATGKALTQKQIAIDAKVGYFSISKAKSQDSFLSQKTLFKILVAISRKYLITYSGEGKPVSIGAFQKGNLRKPEGRHWFVYYYLNRDYARIAEAKKAILEVDLKTSEAELTFFRRSTGQPRMRYDGTIKQYPGKEFFLSFHQRENLVTGDMEAIPALCCFSMAENQLQEDWYVGVFTGTESVGGLCVLQRKEKEIDPSSLYLENISPLVTFLLGHNRIEANELAKHSKIREIEHTLEYLESYQGVYEAYVLESRRDREFIHKIVIEIYESCRIRFYSKITGEHEGLLRQVLKEKFLVGQFSYNVAGGFYDFGVIFDANPSDRKEEIPGGYMLGIYGGIELQTQNPTAGRILLRKINQAYDKSLAYKIPLDDETQLKAWLAKEELLYPFLRGELDRYVDAPIILEKSSLLSENKKPSTPQGRNQLNKLAGLYQVYHLASDKMHIHHSPVEIKANGDVIIEDQTEEEKKDGKGRRYFGKAYYFLGNFLTIAIQKREEEDFFTHLIFYVASTPYSRVGHFHGISSSITSSNTLRASREVLVKIEGNLESACAGRIPIPLAGKGEPSDEELDRKYKGLATFLTGNSHNLIVPKRDPDAPFSRNENYGMLYFSSACYYAATGDPENAKKQMERAFQHGFRDRLLLKKELKDGMLAKPEIQIFIDADRLMIRE